MPLETETRQGTELTEKQQQEGRWRRKDSQRETVLEAAFRPMRDNKKAGEPEQKLPQMLAQV